MEEVTLENAENIEEVQEQEVPEDTPNNEVSEYRELVKEQAEQIKALTDHVNSLTGQISTLIKSGVQVSSVQTNSINPFIEQKTPERFSHVKPLDELDFSFK